MIDRSSSAARRPEQNIRLPPCQNILFTSILIHQLTIIKPRIFTRCLDYRRLLLTMHETDHLKKPSILRCATYASMLCFSLLCIFFLDLHNLPMRRSFKMLERLLLPLVITEFLQLTSRFLEQHPQSASWSPLLLASLRPRLLGFRVLLFVVCGP